AQANRRLARIGKREVGRDVAGAQCLAQPFGATQPLEFVQHDAALRRRIVDAGTATVGVEDFVQFHRGVQPGTHSYVGYTGLRTGGSLAGGRRPDVIEMKWRRSLAVIGPRWARQVVSPEFLPSTARDCRSTNPKRSATMKAIVKVLVPATLAFGA